MAKKTRSGLTQAQKIAITRRLIETSGMTLVDISRAVGASASTVSGIAYGRTKYPREDTLWRIVGAIACRGPIETVASPEVRESDPAADEAESTATAGLTARRERRRAQRRRRQLEFQQPKKKKQKKKTKKFTPVR